MIMLTACGACQSKATKAVVQNQKVVMQTPMTIVTKKTAKGKTVTITSR